MELLQQLDAIFTVQRCLVLAMVMVCVLCIIELFLDKQRKKVDDVIVELDKSGVYWNVTDVCKCCGNQVMWTTNKAGAENKEWLRNMSPIHCCDKQQVEEWDITL